MTYFGHLAVVFCLMNRVYEDVVHLVPLVDIYTISVDVTFPSRMYFCCSRYTISVLLITFAYAMLLHVNLNKFVHNDLI